MPTSKGTRKTSVDPCFVEEESGDLSARTMVSD